MRYEPLRCCKVAIGCLGVWNATPAQCHRGNCTRIVPTASWYKKKGLADRRRKSLHRNKVPKRGLEPPLPLREPGLEPGWCSTYLRCLRVGLMLQVVDAQNTYTLRADIRHCTSIGVTWP